MIQRSQKNCTWSRYFTWNFKNIKWGSVPPIILSLLLGDMKLQTELSRTNYLSSFSSVDRTCTVGLSAGFLHLAVCMKCEAFASSVAIFFCMEIQSHMPHKRGAAPLAGAGAGLELGHSPSFGAGLKTGRLHVCLTWQGSSGHSWNIFHGKSQIPTRLYLCSASRFSLFKIRIKVVARMSKYAPACSMLYVPNWCTSPCMYVHFDYSYLVDRESF